jgi:hypothetical protein
MAELSSTIQRKAAPLRLGAQLVSGPALAGLAQAYVEAINSGAVPQLQNAWQVGWDSSCSCCCCCC